MRPINKTSAPKKHAFPFQIFGGGTIATITWKMQWSKHSGVTNVSNNPPQSWFAHVKAFYAHPGAQNNNFLDVRVEYEKVETFNSKDLLTFWITHHKILLPPNLISKMSLCWPTRQVVFMANDSKQAASCRVSTGHFQHTGEGGTWNSECAILFSGRACGEPG